MPLQLLSSLTLDIHLEVYTHKFIQTAKKKNKYYKERVEKGVSRGWSYVKKKKKNSPKQK